MWNFLAHANNWPFSSALALMLIFAIFEGVGVLFGAGLSGVVDSLLPDLDLGLDAPDLSEPSTTVKFLGWLRFGQVPALIVLIALLTIFGLLGLSLQSFSQSLLGQPLPAWLASVLVLPVTLPVVRGVTGVVAKIMPQDETEAVSHRSFIGKTAVLTLGEAIPGSPAQAKFKDRFGHTHYVMVEPDQAGECFKTGDEILITEQQGSIYRAIRNNNKALSSH